MCCSCVELSPNDAGSRNERRPAVCLGNESRVPDVEE